jgi:hypothetical protein
MASPSLPGDPLEISATEWNQVRAATLGLDGIRDAGGRFIPEILIAKTSAPGIPARSGTTAGSATVTIHTISSGDVLSATTRTETAKNITESAVNGDTYIVIAREWNSRVFIVIVEDCGAGGS